MERNFLFKAKAGWLIAPLLFASSAGAQLVWVAQAPGPNTRGQVENIDDGEVVGAINAVAAHPTDANIIYVGAVNGGIWRTANGMAAAPAWRQQTDSHRSLSIGALEFDPTDSRGRTLVAGTGCFSSFGQCGRGARSGLLRTTDGGANWIPADGGGTLNGLNISGIAPRGATIVISVNAANDPAHEGIWRSINTGGAWTQISGGNGTGLPAGASSDLASDPSNPDRLFTNGGNNGLYRSTNAGATWAKVSDTAMDNLIAGANNIRIAIGNSNNVYVAIVNTDILAGVFRSEDGGESWTAMDVPETVESGNIARGIHPGRQGGMHLSIAADRTNPKLVYIGGDRQPCFAEQAGCRRGAIPLWPNSIGARDFTGRLFRGDASKPAGEQWAHLTHSNSQRPAGGGTARGSAPHADSRDMAMAANGVLLEADDGGIYRRTNPQTNTGDWFSANGDIQATEFHAIAWDAVSDLVIGGTQDNGTAGQQVRSNVRWKSVSTGDGGAVAVDDSSAPGFSTRYSSFQNLHDFRRQVFDAANVFQRQFSVRMAVLGGGRRLQPQFYTPIKLNTIAPTRLIIGAGNAVYESFDQGDTLTELRPSITVNETSPNIIAYGAAGNPDVLYVGSGSRVFIRTAASPAPLRESTAYRGGFVLGIALDPDDPETAYVIDDERVFQTTNAGSSWTDITGNLLALAPGALLSVTYSTSTPSGAVVVGSEAGVFETPGPTFSTWRRLGTGLPRAPVYHMEYDPTDSILLAGTLGRGAWTLTFPSLPEVAVARMSDAVPVSAARARHQEAGDESPAGRQVPVDMNTFQLRPGVIIDPAERRAYITSPAGGIEAVELGRGHPVWSTDAAAKPLGIVGDMLIGHAEAAGAKNQMRLVTLDSTTGRPVTTRTVALPAGVEPSVEASGGEFRATARAMGEDAIIEWQFQERPLQGVRPGREDRLSPREETVPPSAPAEAGENTRSGAFLLNLATQATSPVNMPEADFENEMPPTLLAANERLPGLPETQILSADGRYVLVSQRTGDDRLRDKYTLTVYERETRRRLGEFRSHLSVVPFFVTDSTIVFETAPYVQSSGADLVEEPLKIRAVDLTTGREIWNRAIRDTTDRSPLPP